jgi:hypothetical protein
MIASLFAFCFLFSAAAAAAQVTGSLDGTVTDQGGAGSVNHG